MLSENKILDFIFEMLADTKKRYESLEAQKDETYSFGGKPSPIWTDKAYSDLMNRYAGQLDILLRILTGWNNEYTPQKGFEKFKYLEQPGMRKKFYEFINENYPDLNIKS